MGGTWSDFWNAQDDAAINELDNSLASELRSSKPDKALPIPKVNMSQLLRSLKQEKTSDEEGISALYQSLLMHGYALICFDEQSKGDDLPELIKEIPSRMDNLTQACVKFFEQQHELKLQLADPNDKEQERGYIVIKGLREWLKLRKVDSDPERTFKELVKSTDSSEVFAPSVPIAEKRNSVDKEKEVKEAETENEEPVVLKGIGQPPSIHIWPTYPSDFTDSFVGVFDSFASLSWGIFVGLFNEATKDEKPEKISTMEDLKPVVEEKSSLCLTHYYTPHDQVHDLPHKNPKLLAFNRITKVYPFIESENMKIVEAVHHDSGILSFSVVSQVPGLQIFDRSVRAWIDIERIGRPGVDIFVTVGQKAKMFVNSSSFEPTTQRVVLPCGTEKHSVRFLLDVTK